MGTIAKGEITLNTVNDAYTVAITPASCTINADFDGSNPKLDNAKGVITVKRGSKDLLFGLVNVTTSSSDVSVSVSASSGVAIQFLLSSISNTTLSGYVDFEIVVLDNTNYQTTVRFSFSVIREATMLDWIQDWEGTKTKVGGTYIMTPKLFVGKKEDVITYVDDVPTWKEGALTGVYIGPDLLGSGENSVGIYGYLKDKEIFHINAEGGLIGGWTINETGLQSSDGVLNILAEGSIYAQDPNSSDPYWGLYSDGSAIFAKGNVSFSSNGDASFAGTIRASGGNIAGWAINTRQLYNNKTIIDSNGWIGIDASLFQSINIKTGIIDFPETPTGGVKMWYTSTSDFGFAGWSVSGKVFQLGSTNMIAGWNFNTAAIWTGSDAPYLTQNAYATNSGELTLAPNGLRSNKWYIDADGTAAFVGGSVSFGTETAEMFGWLMRDGRFSSSHAALISQDLYCGLFVSPADLSEISSSALLTTINRNGGIYIYSDGANSIMRAYDKSGNKSFYLSTAGYNSIAAWIFDDTALYVGSSTLADDGFAQANSMLLLNSGIYGHLWKLVKDGSGALAGGKISWDTDGAGYVAGGNVSWDASGAGSIAGGKITWDANGVMSFDDSVKLFWEEGITAAQMMAFGTMLYRDPEFASGYNDTKSYLYSRNVSLTVGDYLSFLQTNGIKLIGSVRITKIRIKGIDTPLWTGYQWLSNSTSIQFVEADALSDLTASSVIVFEGDGEGGTITLTDDSTTDYCLYDPDDSSAIGTARVNLTKSIADDDTAPNDSGKVLSMVVSRWRNASDLRLAGFAFSNDSKKNGQFLVRIVAKIPVGWKISNFHNAYGDGGTSKWLTSRSGTGAYTEYLCLVTCGEDGTFSTINHFALEIDNDSGYAVYGDVTDDSLAIRIRNGLTPPQLALSVTWKVAVATVYDATSSDKVTTYIDKNGIYTGTLRADQIVAGTITSDLIDTDNLIVKHIFAGFDDGEHIEIDPNTQQIAIYDADGVLGTALSGKTYSDGADGIYQNTIKGTADLTPTVSNNSIQKGSYSSTGTSGIRINMPTLYSAVWYSDSPLRLTFDAGKVVISAYSGGYREVSNGSSSGNSSTITPPTLESYNKSYAEAYVAFTLEVADDADFTQNVKSYPIWSRSAYASSSMAVADSDGYHPSVSSSNVQSSNSATDSLMDLRSVTSQTKGYHRIVMKGYVTAKGDSSSAKITWGSSYSGGANLAATYINEFYVSRYFANGFCLGISASQYVSVWKDSSSKMHFKAEESGYGLMLSDQGLQYKHHSGSWMKMPLLVWKGKITCNSSSSTYYASNHLSFNGLSITSVTRKTNSDDSNISKNHIHLVCAFPDSWSTLNLSVSNTIVNLTGYGDTMMKGTLVSMSNTSMTIEISDDASANDGDLLIEIYTIS
jgi:hypothetical protein